MEACNLSYPNGDDIKEPSVRTTSMIKKIPGKPKQHSGGGDRMILPSTSSICYFCHGINQSSTFFSWRKVSFKATCQAVIIYIYPPINHLGLFRSTTLKLEAYDSIWRRFYNVVIAPTQLTTYFVLCSTFKAAISRVVKITLHSWDIMRITIQSQSECTNKAHETTFLYGCHQLVFLGQPPIPFSMGSAIIPVKRGFAP